MAYLFAIDKKKGIGNHEALVHSKHKRHSWYIGQFKRTAEIEATEVKPLR